jgi:cytochrome P450
MAVDFDPFSSTYFDEPLEVYRQLRDEAPLYFSEQYGFYALSRYEDVVAAHKDWQAFSSSHGVDLSTLSTDPEHIRSLRSIIMMDPPDHDTFRALVSRVFTPRAIAALEPMVRTVVADFCDAIGDASSFDAVQDLSGPFPVEIISIMMGVPAGERQQIRHWLDEMLTREPGQMNPSDSSIEASIAMGTYYYGLALARRKEPGDDLLSRLIQATVKREDGTETGLDDAEVAGFCGLLLGAGAETVTKLVANAFVLFARHPDQWQLVRDDPALVPAAVEEILRILPPSQYQGRFSMRDVEIAGGTIPAGHPVLLLTGAATRDERFFDRPDEFDLRRPASHALGFGLGIHSCLGAALARLESRVAIEEMVQRWPCFSVDEGGLRRVHMTNVAGYSNVPVTIQTA